MKKEFLLELGIAEDAAAKIMDENGKDIEGAKRPLASKITTLEQDRATVTGERDAALEGLKQFEGMDKQKYDTALATVEELKTQYAAELAKIERQRENEAFFHSLPDEFINDETMQHYMSKLDALLVDDSAKGKSRQELLDSLIKDEKGEVRPNIYKPQENPNKLVIPPVGRTGTLPEKKISEMSYTERLEFKQANPELYASMTKG